MGIRMIEARILSDGVSLRVDLSSAVLRVFEKHRQARWYQKEAGGQLFASIDGDRWRIMHASGPRRADVRSRFRFWPNRAAEQAEINAFHARGLEYVGDWHTHPEDHPHASPTDIASIGDIVDRSTHHLPGFLMCIVGRVSGAHGLWLSFHGVGGAMVAADLSEVPDGDTPATES